MQPGRDSADPHQRWRRRRAPRAKPRPPESDRENGYDHDFSPAMRGGSAGVATGGPLPKRRCRPRRGPCQGERRDGAAPSRNAIEGGSASGRRKIGEAGWRISAPACAGAESLEATFKIRLAASVATVDFHPLLSHRVGVATPPLVLVGIGERRRHRQRQNCNCDRLHLNAPQMDTLDGSNEPTLTDRHSLVQPYGLRHVAAGGGLAAGVCGISACRDIGHMTAGRRAAEAALPVAARERSPGRTCMHGRAPPRENFQTSGRVIGETALAARGFRGEAA